MSLQFVALSPLLFHRLRGGVACWLTPTPSVVAPLHEVVSVWQRSPVVVSRFLLGYRSQSPFAIDFDLLYDVDASHGIIRIPWNRKESQKSDSKLDSKERKSQILQGILRKLAFYHWLTLLAIAVDDQVLLLLQNPVVQLLNRQAA